MADPEVPASPIVKPAPAPEGKCSCPPPPEPVDSGFFSALMSYRLHQDALMWSRLQLLVGIQGGVLSGAYLLKELPFLGAVLLILGVVLTAVLLATMLRDQAYRDLHSGLIESLGQRLARQHGPDLNFTLRLGRVTSSRVYARELNRAVFWLFFLLDFLFGWLLLHGQVP